MIKRMQALDGVFVPSQTGNWVTHEDHEREVKELERRVRFLEQKSELADSLAAATKAVCDLAELADLWVHGGQSEINAARAVLEKISSLPEPTPEDFK